MNANNNIRQKIFPALISKMNHYVLSVIIIGFTALLCSPLSNSQSYHIVSFIMLFVVSLLATFMGLGPILVASTLSSLIWNYFFIPPHYTFNINKTEDILMFAMFFIIALLNGVLTSRVHKQEKLVRERERRTNALFLLTRELSKASGIEKVLKVAREGIRQHFSTGAIFILQDFNTALLSTELLPRTKDFSQDEHHAAEWVFRNFKKAGRYTDKYSSLKYTIYPLHGVRIKPGVVAIKSEKPFSADEDSFWYTFLTQISNALEREFLGKLAQQARFLDESDRLYKTLFNSISHELRIPVTTILGSADALLTSAHSGNVQSALCNEIYTASIRLNRLIENLLNMSRLETGRISVRLNWHDINDLVYKVTEDLKDELKPFTISVSIPENMPLVRIDFGLIEQVLYNLVLNACQLSPVASEIKLNINYENGRMIIQIMDMGPGFPVDEMNHIFKKFFKINGNKTGGLGLGLSIVKGFVEAHKGTVTAENRKNGGAMFTIKIPSDNPEISDFSKGNK